MEVIFEQQEQRVRSDVRPIERVYWKIDGGAIALSDPKAIQKLLQAGGTRAADGVKPGQYNKMMDRRFIGLSKEKVGEEKVLQPQAKDIPPDKIVWLII